MLRKIGGIVGRISFVKSRSQHCNFSLISDITNYSNKSIAQIKIEDLVKYDKYKNKKDNYDKLIHEDLKIRLANKIKEIEELPYGLSQTPSIRKIEKWYIDSFEELVNYKPNKNCRGQEYYNLLQTIYDRHSPTMINVSNGINEWKKNYEDKYKCKDDNFFQSKDYMITPIETSLDKFYSTRIPLRLILSHCIDMNVTENSTSDNYNIKPMSSKVKPISILFDAYQDASYVCYRDYGYSPDLLVNGEKLNEEIVAKYDNIYFPYVPSHMNYILFEILKNAMKATIDAERDDPIKVILSKEQGQGNKFALKISDKGCGISYNDLNKIWSYFYSTANKHNSSMEVNDFDKEAPMAGFGYGLPISRLLTRYFGGDIIVGSISTIGTDVYIFF